MKDINGFLDDNFQFDLKERAVSQSNGRFENTLQEYFTIFFEEFNKLESAKTIKAFDHLKSDTTDQLYDWLECFHEHIAKEIDLYQALFNDLIYTYDLFIRGKHYMATLHIFEVLPIP